MSTARTVPPAPPELTSVWLVAEREIASKLRSKAFVISTLILFAAALATIVIGGFAAQNLMPWVAYWSGSALAAMAVPAASLAVLALSALIMLATWRVAQPAGFSLAAAPTAKRSQALS